MDTFVTVVGNLTDDPELRFTPNGTAVAHFRPAVTPRIREGDAWRDGETSFFWVNAWRELAANVAESLGKGHRAVVIGRLRTRSWETQDGDKRVGGGDRRRGGRAEPTVGHRQATGCSWGRRRRNCLILTHAARKAAGSGRGGSVVGELAR